MKANMMILILVTMLPLVSSAHWIVGYVNDAIDATSPNGRTIRLLNTNTSEEMFGIVGPSGASGMSNLYMMDCELLPNSCDVGDVLNASLVDDLSGYRSKNPVQIIVSSAGYDVAPNITMTIPFSLANITVDDSIAAPENEIDLTPNSTTKIYCSGEIEIPGGIDKVQEVSAIFYSSSSSRYQANDNNDHYTNSSCEINTSFGDADQGSFNCSIDIQYYANSESWTCLANATDNESVTAEGSDTTFVNPLLSIWVNDSVNFSTVDVTTLSDERIIQIMNLGNTKINLSLYGFGQYPGDGNSMVCTNENLSIEDTKYNLTASTPGTIDPADANLYYTDLESSSVIEPYGLPYRTNDTQNDAIGSTYWRIYVRRGSLNTCQGTIVVGATLS